MISDCCYCGILGLDETGFLADTLALLTVVAPSALCFTLWRIFVTNKFGPRAGIIVLGLDDGSTTYSELNLVGLNSYLRFWYCIVGLLTFFSGLAASAAYQFLRRTLV
jgi:hypothetical protein